MHFRGVPIKILSVAAIVGLSTISAQPVQAEVDVAPVMDTLHDLGKKLPNTNTSYPSSEYILTEVTPQDVNNLPLNVIKYYSPNNLDNEVHYYEIRLKNPVYGEGETSKYFKWAKDGDSVKLVETTVETDAVLTIKYNAGDTVNKFTTGEGQTIESISEIYLGKDIKGIVGSIGKVGNISSKFVGNNTTIEGTDIGYTYSSIYTGIGGSIDSVTSSFVGNNISVNSQGNRVQGSLVKVLGEGSIGELASEFIGNNVNVTSTGTVIHGGMVYVASDGAIENVTSDFIRNTTSTASNNGVNGAIFGAVMRTDGSTNITSSRFIENRGSSSANDYLYGGAIYNAGTSNNNGLTITDSIFVGNSLKSGSTVYGGAIYNAGKLAIENSIFKDNYVIGSAAKAGAIYTTQDMTISANKGKTTEFSGNYTLNGSKKENQSIYVDNANANLSCCAI